MQFSKLSVLFVFSFLLIGMSFACYVWVRKEQQQYALNRHLIAALIKNDTKQALVLVEAGADPNTKEEPASNPSLSSLIKELLHLSPPQVNSSNTAFLIACGAKYAVLKINDTTAPQIPPSPDPHLMHVMLLHGANVKAKDRLGLTSLHRRVIYAIYSAPSKYKLDTEIITLLLAYGADPNEEEEAHSYAYGGTPMKMALIAASPSCLPLRKDLPALLRK